MSAVRTPVGSKRRTQAERSAATRQALLDSMIECLVELGYEHASTTEISERAGLSRGAHAHHFQTRQALVEAAIDDLIRRLGQELSDLVDALPEGPDRCAAGLDNLWPIFKGPLLMAVLELSMHARADPELRAQIAPLTVMLRDTAMPSLRRMFAGGPQDASRDDVIILVTSTMRGLALLPVLEQRQRPKDRAWGLARAHLLSMLTERPEGK